MKKQTLFVALAAALAASVATTTATGAADTTEPVKVFSHDAEAPFAVSRPHPLRQPTRDTTMGSTCGRYCPGCPQGTAP